jgi:hypothetical protein
MERRGLGRYEQAATDFRMTGFSARASKWVGESSKRIMIAFSQMNGCRIVLDATPAASADGCDLCAVCYFGENLPITDRVAKGSRRLLLIRRKKSLPALTATMNSYANEEDKKNRNTRRFRSVEQLGNCGKFCHLHIWDSGSNTVSASWFGAFVSVLDGSIQFRPPASSLTRFR